MFEFPKIKESILNKIRRRNKQLAQLMIKNPRFQEAVSSIRKILGMPSNGFTDQKSYTSYYNKKVKEFINKKIEGIPEYKTKYSSKFDVYLQEKLHGLLLMTGLMANMEKFVEYYLYFNQLPDEDSYFTWVPYCNDYPDELSGSQIKLAIVINDSTTIEEVKAIWPQIMEQQRLRKFMLPVNRKKEINVDDLFDFVDSYKRKTQFKEIKNMERDELIVNLKKEGLSAKNIQQKVREMGYGVIGYEYVSKIIKRYDTRTGIGKA